MVEILIDNVEKFVEQYNGTDDDKSKRSLILSHLMVIKSDTTTVDDIDQCFSGLNQIPKEEPKEEKPMVQEEIPAEVDDDDEEDEQESKEQKPRGKRFPGVVINNNCVGLKGDRFYLFNGNGNNFDRRNPLSASKVERLFNSGRILFDEDTISVEDFKQQIRIAKEAEAKFAKAKAEAAATEKRIQELVAMVENSSSELSNFEGFNCLTDGKQKTVTDIYNTYPDVEKRDSDIQKLIHRLLKKRENIRNGAQLPKQEKPEPEPKAEPKQRQNPNPRSNQNPRARNPNFRNHKGFQPKGGQRKGEPF